MKSWMKFIHLSQLLRNALKISMWAVSKQIVIFIYNILWTDVKLNSIKNYYVVMLCKITFNNKYNINIYI